jgi:peptide/nickel transport system substrate-binding protein
MIIGILSLLLCVSGCGNQTGESAESPAEPQSAQAAASDKTAVVLVAGALDPETSDPIVSSGDFRLYEMIYEPLVRYGDKGSIEPGLAERWESSEDGKTYTFYLRKDVKFSDGTDFTADQVIAAANRWDPETFSSPMKGIEKIDDYTVAITFQDACYPCLTELTYPRPYRIAGPGSFDESGNFVKMIGTGPWMIQSYESNQETVLVQNPYYYGEKPKLDSIVIKQVSDGQSRLMALQSGEADFSISDIPADSLSIVENEEDLSIFSAEGTMGFFLILNDDQPILQDVLVRKALNYAVNKEEIVAQLLNGMGTPATGILPKTNPYVTADNSKGYEYDLEKAKSFLGESGYQDVDGDGILEKDGEKLALRLSLQTEEYDAWKSVCEYLQSAFAQVGIDVELQVMESAAYYDAIWSTQDYDMIIYRSYEDSWNPHGFLRSMFYSSEPGKAICWYDADLNEKLGQVITIMDEVQRQKMYDEIFTQLNDMAFTVPLYYPNRWYVYNQRLSGIEGASTSYEGVKWEKIDIGQ